jgi:dienelactone hydrolase
MTGGLGDGKTIVHFVLPVLLLTTFVLIGDRLRADDGPPMQVLHTPDQVRFGLIGAKGDKPAPTLFVFAHSLETMQKDPIYTEVANLLTAQGILGVAVDALCHGEDSRPGEPAELNGWVYRLEREDDFTKSFTARVSAVLDHLIHEGYTDAERVAAYGTSRGGFLAVHFAAANRRVRAVAGISPVTNLMAISEFSGTKAREKAKQLSLANQAPRLAGCAVWLSIGNHDERVSTDDAIDFTRAVVREAAAKSGDRNVVIPVELVVAPAAGHTKIDQAHELLAAWIVKQFEGPRMPRK